MTGIGDRLEFSCGESDSGPDSPLPSHLPSFPDRPARMICESGIEGCNPFESFLADPQATGDERLIRPIPVLHMLYYCYYLLRESKREA